MPDGLVQVADIANIEEQVIVEEILGLAYRNYKLRELCREIQMEVLHAEVWIGTKMGGSEKVGELVEAELKHTDFSKIEFDLWKNVVHFAVSKEAQLRHAVVNVYDLHAEKAGKELAKMENSQIATALSAATNTVAGSDWGNSANDPSVDVTEAIAQLEEDDQGFEADALVLSPRQHAKLVSNANVRKQLERGVVAEKGKLESYAGLPIIKDAAISAGEAYVLDTSEPAMVIGTGPEVIEEYSGQGRFFDGFALGVFIQPLIVQDSAIRKITGI
jgi:hypothetical protein